MELTELLNRADGNNGKKCTVTLNTGEVIQGIINTIIAKAVIPPTEGFLIITTEGRKWKFPNKAIKELAISE